MTPPPCVLLQSVQVKMGAGKGPLDFKFDRIFGPATEQVSVYESVDHVIEGIMQGFNGTILTYGQVSSQRWRAARPLQWGAST